MNAPPTNRRAVRSPVSVDPPALTPTQEKVQALIAANPGLTIRQVAVRMGVSHATTTYHLGVLVRKNVLARQRDGREVRHFLNSANNADQFLEALFRDERKRKIIEFLAAREVALSINKMAVQLELPFGYLKRTLLQLQTQGLVALPSVCMRYYVEVRPQLKALVAGLNAGAGVELVEKAAEPRDEAVRELPPLV